MNKRIISIIAGILVVGAVAFAASTSSNNDNASNQSPTTNTSSITPTTNETEATAQTQGTGTYTDYDEAKLASTDGKKVLFFHAPWCWQCRSIEAGITTPGSIPSDVTIFKVDYDSNQALRKKYDVRLQTTFIVLDDQNESEKKYVAYEDPYFDSVKRALF